jgi:hypothetical protein
MNRPSSQLRLFDPEGAWCHGCILRAYCGSETTEQVCPPKFEPAGTAGPELLHPARPDFEYEFEQIGGLGFGDIVACPQTLPRLGPYLPQVRWLSSLRNEALAPPIVAVRLNEVTSHHRIRSADELRGHVGLPASTAVVLLLFAKDVKLEAFSSRGAALDEIATGGYEAATTPSYSVWVPGRRPNNLLSLSRSMRTVEALQARGVPTIPRVAWVEPLDAARFADWLNTNPFVDVVSIDLMGYQKRDFERHTALLATFDKLTGERLRYLVNALTSFDRIRETYLAVSPDRITVTDATLRRLPRIGANGRPQRGFRARVRASEDACERAREQVQRAARGSVEEVAERAALIVARREELGALVRGVDSAAPAPR